MVEEKKGSFLEKLNKQRPEGGGFAARLKGEGSSPTEDKSSGFSNQLSKKEKPQSFQEDKLVKRSKKDSAGFAEDIRKKRSDCVYLVRGKDRGRAAWHYVLIDKPKKEMFLAAAKSGSLDVAEYGEVLYSGWGQDPPEEIKNKIDEQYN